MIGGLAFALLAVVSPAPAAAQASGPGGAWIGQYQTARAFHGRLRLAVEQVAGQWAVEVMSANEHDPSEEPEQVDWFSVAEDSLQWALHWGPTEVTFVGEIQGDFIVGTLVGREGVDEHFRGVWTAVREAAGRERPESDS